MIRTVGIGKHSDEMIEQIAEKDLKALSDLIRSQHYLVGIKPTRADACAFASLALVLYAPFDTPQRQFIIEHCPNLREYCDRIRGKFFVCLFCSLLMRLVINILARYYPDWNELTTMLRGNTDWKRRRPTSRPVSSVGAIA